MATDRYSKMIDEVRQWYRNGTPWPVAVEKVANGHGVRKKDLQAEMSRRSAAVRRAKKRRKENV